MWWANVEGLREQGVRSVLFNMPKTSKSHDGKPASQPIFRWITAFSAPFALARSSPDIGQLAGSRRSGIKPWLVRALRRPKVEC